jgi:hypothetical protein
MLKKRLLILVAMLFLLTSAVSTSTADEVTYCSCSVQCREGKASCKSICSGGDFFDQWAAGAQCCQEAREATGPIDCPPSSPFVTSDIVTSE